MALQLEERDRAGLALQPDTWDEDLALWPEVRVGAVLVLQPKEERDFRAPKARAEADKTSRALRAAGQGEEQLSLRDDRCSALETRRGIVIGFLKKEKEAEEWIEEQGATVNRQR